MEPRYIRGYLLEFARVLSHGGVGCLGIPDNTNGPKERIHRWVQSNRFGYLVYKNLWHRAMPVMEGHGLTSSEVTSLMNSVGVVIRAYQLTLDVGPNVLSYRYYIMKP
jgi:ubiquinone/menaquinone biosynthesis C-methylase UbiE